MQPTLLQLLQIQVVHLQSEGEQLVFASSEKEIYGNFLKRENLVFHTP